MADELDLETGDPARADDRSERRRRRRERTDDGSKKDKATNQREDTEVRSRLDRVLARIAEARRAKDDDELADAITEDGAAMAQGIISLTKNIPVLRMPIIMVLNVLEPVMAFGRVGRILGGRFLAWRGARAQAAMEAEAAAMTPEEYAAAMAEQEAAGMAMAQ